MKPEQCLVSEALRDIDNMNPDQTPETETQRWVLFKEGVARWCGWEWMGSWASGRKGEVPDNIEVLQQRASSLNINRLLIKKTQISQVKECSVFLCTEGCKNGDSLKSFL